MIATTETEIRMNATSAALLEEAETLFLAGDLRRASGKAWEAVEHPLSAMMRERDWNGWDPGETDEMGSLIRFGGFISKESDDPDEFLTLLASAGSLYVNSHEDWFGDFTVRGGIDDARELITILERIDETVRHPSGMDKERPAWLP